VNVFDLPTVVVVGAAVVRLLGLVVVAAVVVACIWLKGTASI